VNPKLRGQPDVFITFFTRGLLSGVRQSSAHFIAAAFHAAGQIPEWQSATDTTAPIMSSSAGINIDRLYCF
jgi:hypothetical protein